MDVDALTIEQRDEMMRKGQCFGCGKQGHLSRNCPDKKKTILNNNDMQKKMKGKELHAHIRSLTALMDEEEKEKFYDEAEEKGF